MGANFLGLGYIAPRIRRSASSRETGDARCDERQYIGRDVDPNSSNPAGTWTQTCYDACERERTLIYDPQKAISDPASKGFLEKKNPNYGAADCKSAPMGPPQRIPPPNAPPAGSAPGSCTPWTLDSSPKFRERWTRFCYDICTRKAKQVVRDGHEEIVRQHGFGTPCPPADDPNAKMMARVHKLNLNIEALRDATSKHAHTVTLDQGGYLQTSDGVREQSADTSMPETGGSPFDEPLNGKQRVDFKALMKFQDKIIKLAMEREELLKALNIPSEPGNPSLRDTGIKLYLRSRGTNLQNSYIAANQLFQMFSDSVSEGVNLARRNSVIVDMYYALKESTGTTSRQRMRGLGDAIEPTTWLWIMAGAAGLYLLTQAQSPRRR
jgi:hypothetical protein